MPRGKYVNHKGRIRHFTSPEELEEQRRQAEKEQQWRKNKSHGSSNEDEGADHDEPKAKSSGGRSKRADTSSEEESCNDSNWYSGTDSDSESETEAKAKGVENLIEVENPNRVQKKTKKLSQLTGSSDAKAKPELSRREREQLEKQRAYANYQKLHAAGKTEEARADLARLAIIKQQREEAAKRRDEEKRAKEMAHQKKMELAHRSRGKKP